MVTFTWCIFDAGSIEVWRERSEAVASSLQHGSVVRARLPLNTLSPGEYRVRLEMRAGTQTESREGRFTVRQLPADSLLSANSLKLPIVGVPPSTLCQLARWSASTFRARVETCMRRPAFEGW